MSEPWWKSAVLYQIYPRSFQDSNGDGTGDLPGIIARLPYLAELGVDALWLSPIFTSPMADFGYDVADYIAIDPLFGTMKDFDALVREAVCELANQIIGNAVTTLNDQGFHFHVLPPTLLTSEQGGKSSEYTEALVMCFSTSSGKVFMNVALHYHRRRAAERATVAG